MKAKSKKFKSNLGPVVLGLSLVAGLLLALVLTVGRVGNLQDVLLRPKAGGGLSCEEVADSWWSNCKVGCYGANEQYCVSSCDSTYDGKIDKCDQNRGKNEDCYSVSPEGKTCTHMTAPFGTCGGYATKNECLESIGQTGSTTSPPPPPPTTGGGTTAVGVPSTCAKCIISKRGDLVAPDGAYATGGWNVANKDNYPKIAANWCGGGAGSPAATDCKNNVLPLCSKECEGANFSGGGGSSGGGGNGGGGGSNGDALTNRQSATSAGCSASSPAAVWSCFQNGVNGVGRGNCAFCLSQKGKPPTGGTGGACFTSCFSKTGNGSGCTYVCANNASCWNGCSSQGKSCLATCLAGGGGTQTHLECKSSGGDGTAKINDSDASIKFSGPWTYASGGGGSTAAFKGDYHYAPGPLSNSTVKQNLNASATLTFTGKKVGFGALSWTNRGNIDVYIDDDKVDSVKSDSGGAVLPVVWNSQALTCGEHTIKLTQSETAGSNGGRLIAIDYFDYDSCQGTSGKSCVVVNGAGDNQEGCTKAGNSCGVVSCTNSAGCPSGQVCDGGACRPSGEVDACWGNLGANGRCYDCNGDGTINILDFSCFVKHWLENVL